MIERCPKETRSGSQGSVLEVEIYARADVLKDEKF